MKKVYVAALNALGVVGAFNFVAFPSDGLAQGGIVKQGNPPWIVDATTTSILYGALISSIASGTNLIGGVDIRQGGNALSSTNGIYTNLLTGNAVVTTANPLAAQLSQGGSALSSTNGIYSNLVQGNAVVASTNPVFVRQTDATNLQVIEPCQATAKLYQPINISIATTTRIVTEAASKYVYVCSLNIIVGSTGGVALMEGTGATCTGGTPAGIAGGTSGATGWQFVQYGGMTIGNGMGTVFKSGTTAYSMCLVNNVTGQISGGITYVQLP